jgi:Domain of unknown function (DUF1844)
MVEEGEGGFKVTDRRPFNPDGSLRDDVEPTAPVPETPAEEKVIEIRESPEEEAAAGQGEMSEFMEVVMDLAAPAFIHLGMAEHPATGKPQVNLPAAQQSIEMLRVLRNKTKGNLTKEEEQFFDGLLGDLQMQFVSMRRQS